MKEWEERLGKVEAIVAETARLAQEREELAQERAKKHDKWFEVNEKWLADYKAENKIAFDELRKNIYGISTSNGMFSEDYFYESLKKSKTLGGIHFDIVESDMKSAEKQKDGSKLAGQYDIVMINDNAVCIVEVKYRVRMENVLELVNKDVSVFKTLFPKYASYQIYLAIGGMTFENGVVDTAKELGVGLLKQNGDAVEIEDAYLKAY